MKKKIAKFLIAALFMVMSFVVIDFDLSWAEETAVDPQEETTEQVEVEKKVEEEMDFLYIESASLETPGTQNIAVSWQENLDQITKIILQYEDEDGNKYELEEANRTENSVLFTKDFSSEETGTYTIKAVKYYIGEEEHSMLFDDVEINASFDVVNEVKDSMEDNIATVELSEKNIQAADVEAQMESALMTAEVNTEAVAAKKAAGKDVVVVLDPGHGGNDPGAVRNGLKESTVNIKIAKYCKAELESYSGVKVYLTHNGEGFKGDAATDLQARVNVAKSKNADILVSLHINAGGGRGAEVYRPNQNYDYGAYVEGTGVSNEILDELTALGLVDRGVKIRNSTDNTRYPNGSLADYYGIIRRSKLAGFPGIIVEHAFIDNASDAAFMKSESNLKKLGIADATGIASYYGLYKEAFVNIEDGTYTINSTSSDIRLAVSDSSLSNGVSVVTKSRSEEVNSAQRFELISTGKKEYKILMEHSGKSLDVKSASTAAGATVQQYEWNGSNAQRWYIVDPEDGSDGYYIKSKVGTYLSLSEDDSFVVTAIKAKAEKWTFEASESRPIADGIYGFANKTDSSMMLDINNASMSNGGNVQLYKMNSTLAQKFDVRYAGNGYYKITTVHSNKALDVANASTKVGTNLWQYNTNGTNAQLWKFIDAGNGYYYIKSKLGTVVSPASTQIKNGTNANMAALSNKNIQKWMPEDISKSVSDGRYLILSGKDSLRAMTDKNGNTQINIYENISEQKYQISYVSNGYYKITNEATGKVLEVAGSSKSPKANLREGTWRSSNNANQLWNVLYIGNNKYCFKSKLGTFIDVSSGSMAENNNIWMYSYNGTSAQIWKLDSSKLDQPVQPLKDGTYIFESALKSKRVMDVASGSTANKANIQLYTSNNTAAQIFNVIYTGNGYYKITNEKSGKSLDVANGSTKAKTNLWQYEVNDTDAQLWKFINAGNGYYYIKSPKGTVIDVKSANTRNRTNVWMYTLNGTKAQKWKPEKCQLTSIVGKTDITAEEMAAYYNAIGKQYPYTDNDEAATIQEFAQIYIEECEAEGIRADVAFCQAMKETGWLQFKGDVKSSQYNFAGIGATGNGNPGLKFESIRLGIRVHVQHLKAYASEDKLVNKCVDPRFSYVQRGVSPYVEWLGQKENPAGKGWATSKGYGESIVKMMKEL